MQNRTLLNVAELIKKLQSHIVVNEQDMSARERLHVRDLNVNELKVSSIESGIRCYYKLNKAELIHALEGQPVVNDKILPAIIRETQHDR